MNYLSLHYFLSIAYHLNFSKAAEALHISQPGLSQQIAILEKELDVKLLKRSTRQVSLTEEGEFLYQQLTPSFESIQNSVNELKQIGATAHMTIKIATVPSAASHIVPNLLKELKRRYPKISFFIKETTSVHAVKLVHSGEYHLAFIRTPIDVKRTIRSPLQWKEFKRHELKLAVSSKHPSALNSTVNLEDFAEELFFHFDPDHSPALYSLVEHACLSAGFVPKTVGTGPEILTIANLIKEDIGITLLPEDMIELMNDRDVIGLDLKDIHLFSSLSLIWHEENYRQITEAAVSILDMVEV
ncbi:LysR family transcriptional regulator [Halobacillus andaensis]|uniref:LysR family transcriptional regulator n=1 Tax=Halobacillus andaensis TaxID=1176239 RepID=A0A917B340_HALAA|nr:LysR family transcriptional regulator [Halobacillus andaensis]MBP2004625.1 DNA-binding transcriptional LysR family regulator [Halobacillus andaensis]GGF20215.1 LysR family transcriptional regulator [Halobacillus andaensis]